MKRVSVVCGAAFLLIFLGGCATAPRASGGAGAEVVEPVREEPADRSRSTEAGTWGESNSRVEKWIQYFTTTDRERFQRFLGRGQKYRKVIEDLLVENELPPELYFLALIESGYQNSATSSASAAGVWQFMPRTGRRYGLQVDHFVDERRDPIRATEAAAKYLRDLYNIFGSWSLAMAGYNAGEYRIINTIVKGKSRDFWTLADANLLPRETADYVPKVIAASKIGANPEEYGFTFEEGAPYPELEAVEVPSPLRFVDLAKLADLPVEALQDLNPHVRGGRTPANVARYEVWFPKDKVASFRAHSLELKKLQRAPAVAPPRAEKSRKNYHNVKSGENLTSIARAHGVSVNYLIKVNHLSSTRLLPGATIRITSASYRPQAVSRYHVKKGENLDRIARRFRVTAQQLKRDNDLNGSRLYPGQILLIRKDPS